jgi:hypothetical protein
MSSWNRGAAQAEKLLLKPSDGHGDEHLLPLPSEVFIHRLIAQSDVLGLFTRNLAQGAK